MLRTARHWMLTALVGACAPVTVRAADVPALPQHLRDTGLYAEGVLAFSPQYPLWSDGAVKNRWIYLPPGTSIDATQPDAWEFPARHETVEGVPPRPCARDAFHRTHRGW